MNLIAIFHLQSNLHAVKINKRYLKQRMCKAGERMEKQNMLQLLSKCKQVILGGRAKQVVLKVQEARNNKTREKRVALVYLEYQVIMR